MLNLKESIYFIIRIMKISKVTDEACGGVSTESMTMMDRTEMYSENRTVL